MNTKEFGYCQRCLERKIQELWCWKCGQKTGTYSETSAIAVATKMLEKKREQG